VSLRLNGGLRPTADCGQRTQNARDASNAGQELPEGVSPQSAVRTRSTYAPGRPLGFGQTPGTTTLRPCTANRHMPSLTFRIKKRPDADAMLVLVREDGSSTAGPIGPAGGYGPVHDLAHYVVERTLGLSEAFLGLVASGWEIKDFETKGTARRLPVEAVLAEIAAGELSRQAVMWQWSSASEYSWAVEATMRTSQPEYTVPPIIEQAFEAMRLELLELRQRWNELAPGETLELAFDAARRATAPRPVPESASATRQERRARFL
jgi:hypothetical protein